MMPQTPEKAFSSGVAVITGAGGGLGSGLARHIASFGMAVIIADIDLERAEEVASDIRAANGKAEARGVDVSRPDVQLLINNAAIETLGPLWELSSSRWEAILNANIHGPIHGVRAFLPRMMASGKECWIANVSSVGAFTTIPGQSAYAVTKHSVQAFTESLYVELRSEKAPIHVSAVIPGLLNTGIFDWARHEDSTVDPAQKKHRRAMAELARKRGMGIEEASRLVVQQVAAGKLWVSTHPAILTEILQQRTQFYESQGEPNVPPA
ncbi:hypothetical protein FVER14953_13393 [Fusarium verticillioides]|nr:hypothetical protein FVER14953_13393 [Fusarium verticillioides]